MRIRPGCGGLCYVGAAPAGQGCIRIPLSEMTKEQMRGWLESDYKTASKYIDEEGEEVGAVLPTIDNKEGEPLPVKPAHDEAKRAKKQQSETKASKWGI